LPCKSKRCRRNSIGGPSEQTLKYRVQNCIDACRDVARNPSTKSMVSSPLLRPR
jgi:hypothetical protein